MNADSTGGSNPWANARGNSAPDFPSAPSYGGTSPAPFDPGPVGGAPIPVPPPASRAGGGITLGRNQLVLIGGVVAVVLAAIVGVMVVTGNEPAEVTTPAGGAYEAGSSGSGASGGYGGADEPPAYQPSAPVVLPPGAVVCSVSGSGRFANAARGTDVTSCPFADAVRDAVRSTGDLFPRTVDAYSPVTKKNYAMHCTGTDLITCRGGNNAVVYVY